jgi:hypothetical protein
VGSSFSCHAGQSASVTKWIGIEGAAVGWLVRPTLFKKTFITSQLSQKF